MNPELAMNVVGAQRAGTGDILPGHVGLGILREARAVGIVGSRGYPELERVDALVGHLHPEAVIVNGGAEGVDQRATSAGLATRHPVVELKPIGASKKEWVAAAFWRNGGIALCSDVVVAFWDGESKGTADTIRKALGLYGKCVVALPGQPAEVWLNRL